MINLINRVRSLLTFCLALAYLSNLFIQSPLLNNLALILMVIVVALCFPVVTGSSKAIGYISFSLSIILFLVYRAPLSVWKEALQENFYLVVMFATVPLLKIPIQHGGYFKALQSVFQRYVRTNSRFYLLVSFVSAFVGILVNLAVVPLVHQISQASELSRNRRLLSSAISRGFATCTIWAPTTAAIALIVQLSGAKWPLFFPFGIMFGIIAGLIGYGMTLFEERKAGSAPRAGEAESATGLNLHKVIELGVFSFILILGITVVSIITGIQTVIVVSLASLVFPVIWLGLIGRLPVLLREFKGEYFQESLPKIKNEIVLFVGAGLFATSITYSGLGNYIPRVLSFLVGSNALLLAIVVIFGSLVLSALGIHPIITTTVIGGTVRAASFGVSPTYMALVLATCWAMGISVSPSSPNIIAISGLVEQSPIQVGSRWNGGYVLLVSAVLILTLTAFRTGGLL